MGKKLLELSNTPECAFKTRLYLNNKYFLDGRYPNSYANVAPTSEPRPRLEGAGGLRQGALHVRGRLRAQDQAGGVRR